MIWQQHRSGQHVGAVSRHSAAPAVAALRTFLVESPVLPGHPSDDHAAQRGESLELSVGGQLR